MSKPLFEFVKVAAGGKITADLLKYLGFKTDSIDNPFFGMYSLFVGREREICVSNPGTPNEFIHLAEGKPEDRNVFTLRNFDYDGFTSPQELQSILHFFNPAANILRPAESPDAGREGVSVPDAVVNELWDEYCQPYPAKTDEDFGIMKKYDFRWAINHYFRSHFPTPADPGSQVEAVLNWINENMPGLYVNQPVWSIETHDPAGFESDSSKEVDYTTADLITLYKQSL